MTLSNHDLNYLKSLAKLGPVPMGSIYPNWQALRDAGYIENAEPTKYGSARMQISAKGRAAIS